MTERRSYAVTAAVWLGALVVVGLPTIAGVSAAGRALSRLVTGGRPTGVAALALAFAALVLGVVAADVATRIRLHGWSELHRGSPRRRFLRHVVLSVPAVTVLALLVNVVVGIAVAEYDEHEPLALTILAATAAALGLTLVRSVRAFVAGRQTAGDDAGRRA